MSHRVTQSLMETHIGALSSMGLNFCYLCLIILMICRILSNHYSLGKVMKQLSLANAVVTACWVLALLISRYFSFCDQELNSTLSYMVYSLLQSLEFHCFFMIQLHTLGHFAFMMEWLPKHLFNSLKGVGFICSLLAMIVILLCKLQMLDNRWSLLCIPQYLGLVSYEAFHGFALSNHILKGGLYVSGGWYRCYLYCSFVSLPGVL